jgi:uncharacterized glyoxalase superfamily protein PhnB
MLLKYLTPMLWTDDLAKTISFYQTVLGFELDEYNEGWGWCHMHKDKVSLMFCRPFGEDTSCYKGPAFTGSLYIYTDDVDGLWQTLRETATVSYPIGNYAHHMREFAILDNNGYMMQFGRDMRDDETVTDCD